MNAKKEILKLVKGETIEAVKLFLNEETDVTYLGLSREKGVRFLFPKMFRGDKVTEAMSLIDYEFERLHSDEGIGRPVVTVWTKSYVIFGTHIHYKNKDQETFKRVDRNPPNQLVEESKQ